MIKMLLMKYFEWRRDYWFMRWLKNKDGWMFRGKNKEFEKYYLWRNRWLKLYGYPEGEQNE